MDNSTIDLWPMLIGLLGGLAIFLFGLDQLTDMLKATAGARMRDGLARITTNRFKGVVAGAFTTAVIQSSSVTTVLVVGFVSAGLMTLQQSIGVIMGASIGTTVTAQIVAFKVTQYALVAVIIGFVMQFFFQNHRVKRYGMMVLGLGLVFYGMNMMGDATRPLRSYQPFIELLAQLDNPVLAILLSAGFTALIQSSSATTGVIIVLGSQGLISLEQGVALVLGANIGTCVTALLAAIGKQRQGMRSALIHVIFNVSGVLIWFGFIDELAQFARWLSPTAPELRGMERLAAEIPRQIANAHTLFNVGNTLIFIWFTGALAWLVTRLLPDKRPTAAGEIEPRFLNRALIETPALALDAARMEIVRMAGHVLPMVRQAGPAVLEGSQDDLDRIHTLDHEVDVLHAAIVKYLGRVSREELISRETKKLSAYLSIATLFESIGDVVETDLVHVGSKRLERNVSVSADTQSIINELADRVTWAVESAAEAVDRGDMSLARKVVDAKDDVSQIADRISNRLVDRLIAEDPHRTATYRIESQLVENYLRIFYFAKRVAKLVAQDDLVDEGPVPAIAPAV
ncbi:MAG: Na/Pi cotransporter family protein [Gammaproteobacteria bacterium]|nr:Na/Pi cotransporter family protein [Gammaproteobacteria bacterium]MDH3749506.1 Na/Pi cotransporter family protein [Gammaproteobacteria bacterium]